jgi:hypothetical protein
MVCVVCGQRATKYGAIKSNLYGDFYRDAIWRVRMTLTRKKAKQKKPRNSQECRQAARRNVSKCIKTSSTCPWRHTRQHTARYRGLVIGWQQQQQQQQQESDEYNQIKRATLLLNSN